MTGNRRVLWRCALLVCALLAVLALPGVRQVVRLRVPAAAGPYYPPDADTLRKTVAKYFDEAKADTPNARLLACIVPHGAYGFSGAIAAQSFKELKKGQYHRVIVLAPSNYATFHGCSIPAVQAFMTPLGAVPLDGPAIRQLSFSSLIDIRSVRYDSVPQRQTLHEKEHSIEVVLPFLQEKLGEFRLIPILVGGLRTPQGQFETDALASIARTLREVIDERTLLVVSTNFTQYGADLGYAPFKEDVAGEIEKLDKAAFSRIINLDDAVFRKYLRETRNPIGGQNAILILMRLLPKSAHGQVLAHDMSGRMIGKFDRSVSYASINFYDLERAPLEPAALPEIPESEMEVLPTDEADTDE